ncbi:MAG: hypothetical protein V2B18_15220 [Pseudomonadota bacterium]
MTELAVRYPDKHGDMPLQHLLIISVGDESDAIRLNFNIETKDLVPLNEKLGRFLSCCRERSEFGELLARRLTGEEEQ